MEKLMDAILAFYNITQQQASRVFLPHGEVGIAVSNGEQTAWVDSATSIFYLDKNASKAVNNKARTYNRETT